MSTFSKFDAGVQNMLTKRNCQNYRSFSIKDHFRSHKFINSNYT